MDAVGDYGSSRFGLGAMSDRLSWLADDLRRTGEQLREAVDGAAERCYEAASPDDLVRVRVNGRCRVTSIELSPSASRQDPDTLDAMLTATLNDALRQARVGTQEAVLDSLPARMRASIEQTMDDARWEAGQ